MQNQGKKLWAVVFICVNCVAKVKLRGLAGSSQDLTAEGLFWQYQTHDELSHIHICILSSWQDRRRWSSSSGWCCTAASGRRSTGNATAFSKTPTVHCVIRPMVHRSSLGLLRLLTRGLAPAARACRFPTPMPGQWLIPSGLVPAGEEGSGAERFEARLWHTHPARHWVDEWDSQPWCKINNNQYALLISINDYYWDGIWRMNLIRLGRNLLPPVWFIRCS